MTWSTTPCKMLCNLTMPCKGKHKKVQDMCQKHALDIMMAMQTAPTNTAQPQCPSLFCVGNTQLTNWNQTLEQLKDNAIQLQMNPAQNVAHQPTVGNDGQQMFHPPSDNMSQEQASMEAMHDSNHPNSMLLKIIANYRHWWPKWGPFKWPPSICIGHNHATMLCK